MASAKERVTIKRQQQQQQKQPKMVQIISSVDDPSKSINKMIDAGKRACEQQRNKHFERNKNKAVISLSPSV